MGKLTGQEASVLAAIISSTSEEHSRAQLKHLSGDALIIGEGIIANDPTFSKVIKALKKWAEKR